MKPPVLFGCRKVLFGSIALLCGRKALSRELRAKRQISLIMISCKEKRSNAARICWVLASHLLAHFPLVRLCVSFVKTQLRIRIGMTYKGVTQSRMYGSNQGRFFARTIFI